MPTVAEIESAVKAQIMGESTATKAKPSKPKKKPAMFTSEKSATSNTDLLTYKEFTNNAGEVPKGVTDERIFPPKRDPEHYPEEIRQHIPAVMDGFEYSDQVYYMFLGALNKLNVFAVGGAGTGKDTAAKQYAALAGLPYWRITGMLGTTPDMILGRKSLNDKGVVWEDGDAAIWARNGGILVVSEPAAMPPDTLFSFQSALEDNGFLTLMDHPDPADRMLPLHEECCTIWTSNVKGKGENSHQFAAAGVMDESTRNRFHIWLQFDYMSAAKESGIIQREYPEISAYLADKMAQFAASLRNANNVGSIQSQFSLRNMLPWAKYTVDQRNPASALHSTWLYALNDEEIDTVKQLWSDVDFDEFVL